MGHPGSGQLRRYPFIFLPARLANISKLCTIHPLDSGNHLPVPRAAWPSGGGIHPPRERLLQFLDEQIMFRLEIQTRRVREVAQFVHPLEIYQPGVTRHLVRVGADEWDAVSERFRTDAPLRERSQAAE